MKTLRDGRSGLQDRACDVCASARVWVREDLRSWWSRLEDWEAKASQLSAVIRGARERNRTNKADGRDVGSQSKFRVRRALR